MSDLQSPGWYSAQYGSENRADNPHGLSILSERRNSALMAHLEAGGKLSDFIASQSPPANTRTVLAEAFASMERRAAALKSVANGNQKAAE